MIAALTRLIRPKQWVKNIFVYLPVIFSGQLLSITVIVNSSLVFVAFCMISSSVYCLNDVLDLERDRSHPIKRKRPIASGEVTSSMGVLLSLFLLALSLLISISISTMTLFVISLYYIINLFYSFYLKDLPIVDVITISSGFVLRMLSGTTVVTSIPSSWIFLTTFFLSLFLGFSKRRIELADMSTHPHQVEDSRKVLQEYSIQALDNIISALMAISIICYSLYTASDDVSLKFGNNNLIYTIPFVVYGMFYYYIKVCSQEMPEDHSTALFKSKPILLSLLLWIATCILVMYGW